MPVISLLSGTIAQRAVTSRAVSPSNRPDDESTEEGRLCTNECTVAEDWSRAVRSCAGMTLILARSWPDRPIADGRRGPVSAGRHAPAPGRRRLRPASKTIPAKRNDRSIRPGDRACAGPAARSCPQPPIPNPPIGSVGDGAARTRFRESSRWSLCRRERPAGASARAPRHPVPHRRDGHGSRSSADPRPTQIKQGSRRRHVEHDRDRSTSPRPKSAWSKARPRSSRPAAS